MPDIRSKKVAIVIDNYFEESELTGPLLALKSAGADVDVIGLQAGTLQSMNHADKSKTYTVSKSIGDISFADYDALVLPGGAVNADNLRMNSRLREWLTQSMADRKLIAAICHAPWALASAGVLTGKKLTSYFTIQDDLRNAGAQWVDEEVVIDDNLITSRQPDDILAFNQALITKLRAA